MLESLLFLILIVVGAFFALVSFVIIGLGLLSKSKTTYKVGLWTLSVPAICFGTIFIFYAVVVPWLNGIEMEKYSGTYILDNSQPKVILVLKDDGTYTCDKIPEAPFSRTGTWKTGGIDGLFELREASGNHHFLQNGIDPDNGDLIVSFSLRGEELRFVQKEK